MVLMFMTLAYVCMSYLIYKYKKTRYTALKIIERVKGQYGVFIPATFKTNSHLKSTLCYKQKVNKIIQTAGII